MTWKPYVICNNCINCHEDQSYIFKYILTQKERDPVRIEESGFIIIFSKFYLVVPFFSIS